MAKTLLQIVRHTLETMDSDVVDSIFLDDGGTEESEQIASFASQLYAYLYSVYEWPHSKVLTQLEPLADSDKPNYLQIPDNCSKVEWIKYRETDVTWLTPEDFINFLNSRNNIIKDSGGVESNSLQDNTTTITSYEGVPLYIKTNSNPTYYTSFDGKKLVFDSYDSVNESTLQNSNSLAYLVRTSEFYITNTFEPDIPEHMMPLFQAELNRESSLRLRQVDSPVDAKRALVGWAALRTRSDRLNKKKISGFGRK